MMPYKDEEQAREAARLRKQKQRSHPVVTPANVTPEEGENVTPLTEQGLTIESMSSNERELWDRFGFDCRSPVYRRLLVEQRGNLRLD